ncbi:MAG TPA: DNA repair protein RecN [Tenericutes bacterium]|nr:DNA repair protein RecN [Mycoplasmatota bacterium]
MLLNLLIKNFAIIDDIEINFKPGFTVVTGETGSGKSIIINAINILVGERASIDYIKTGCEKAYLQATFLVQNNKKLKDFIDENDIILEDEKLIITRVISRDGNSSIKVNGIITPLQIIKKLGELLIDIHNQHENTYLLNSSNHIHLVDNYGKINTSKFKALYSEYKALKEEYEIITNASEMNEKLAIYEYQLSELEKANIMPGEEEELKAKKLEITNFEKIYNSLTNIRSKLLETGGTLELLNEVMKNFQKISSYNETYQNKLNVVTDSYYSLCDIAEEVSHELNRLSFDENTINEIEERLYLIQNLKRKYNLSTDDFSAVLDDLKTKIEQIKNREEIIEKLKLDLSKKYEELKEEALILSAKRKEIALELTEKIVSILIKLYMEKVALKIDIISEQNNNEYVFNENGIDKIEFLIRTNTGEDLKPLKKIASGGELSRIMLALKSIFATTQEINTIIFDEIDTGVSGKVANALGMVMKDLSNNIQVITITHLPQIVSFADEHLKIIKEQTENGTNTIIKVLNYEERIYEIANIISGNNINSEALDYAKELLRENSK